MSKTKSLSYSLSALALCAATPALADVTATELWAEWQAVGLSMGQVMATQDVIETDTGLVLAGFSSTIADPDVTIVSFVEEITMTNNDDGSVTIVPSDLYTLTFTFEESPRDPPVNLVINLMSEGLLMTASGDPGARVYDYTAASMTVEDGPITGGDGNPPTIDGAIVLQDFTGNYVIDSTNPDDIAYESSASFSGIEGNIDILPPAGEDGRLKFSFSMGATDLSGDGSLGNLMQLAVDPDLVPTGFDIRADYAYERISFELNFEDDYENFAVFYANDGGSVYTEFTDTAIDYRLTAQGANARIAAADLPIPIEVSVGSAELALQMPLAPGPGLSDFASRVAYEDVVLGAQIWTMADPTQSIPRDPISVVMDVSGTVQLFLSLMEINPEEMDAPPGEVRELSLNELRIAAGGAELTGSGEATFAAGQAVPMPVGAVELQLSGGNALLDAIQSAGIAPVQELAMARGMLGALTRPGATPDTLETRIEFGADGSITANGVPLQ